jgi:ribosomal 50S subunit-recycling heat shock protein
MPLSPVTLDVVPHRDVFVPFELPLSDLEPGWYTMVCDVEVDGLPSTFDGGGRFSVPWPRATVRRGQVKVGKRVRLGEQTVHVEQVDCTGDSIRISMRVDPPGHVTVRLTADGRRLQVLETELDEESGRAKATAYPVMRGDEVLRIELKGRARGSEDAIEVPLT